MYANHLVESMAHSRHSVNNVQCPCCHSFLTRESLKSICFTEVKVDKSAFQVSSLKHTRETGHRTSITDDHLVYLWFIFSLFWGVIFPMVFVKGSEWDRRQCQAWSDLGKLEHSYCVSPGFPEDLWPFPWEGWGWDLLLLKENQDSNIFIGESSFLQCSTLCSLLDFMSKA
jgi:hypothetical protein